MKKYVALILCILLFGSLTACQNTKKPDSQGEVKEDVESSDSTESAGSTENTENSESESSGFKTLVAYFAYSENVGDTSSMEVDAITSASLNSKTNNTEGNLQVMAQVIEEKTGADVFHILMTEPYDMDYSTMLPVAVEQMNNGEHPSLQENISNLEEYDVIFIGMPVWNAELPPAMQTLFAEHDFSGKTIVPFGIHLGSRFGRIIDQIKELEPEAEVAEGFTINAGTSNDDVRSEFGEWLDGLSLE